MRKRRRKKRSKPYPLLIRRTLGVLIILAFARLILSGVWGMQLARTAHSAENHLAVLQTNPPQPTATITLLRADLQTAASQTTRLRRSLWPWLPIARRIDALPTISSSANLLISVDAFLQATARIEQLAAPMLAPSEQPFTQRLLTTVAGSTAQRQLAANDLVHARAARDRIEPQQLPFSARAYIPLLDSALQQIDVILAALDAAPSLLGAEEPHHVLILLQNADELRATGGFITSTAYITLRDGEIAEITMLNSGDPAIDRFEEVYHPAPPDPLLVYMNLPVWALRDANWSPHFPTSAEQSAKFYEAGREVPVDTVVALDQYTLQSLMTVFGEVTLADGTLVSADNIIEFIHQSWLDYSEDDPLARKDFILDYGPAFIEHVQTTFGSGVPDLTLLRQLQNQPFQIYSRSAQVQQVSEIAGLSGMIPTDVGDYLLLLRSNVGYNKTDYFLRQSADYHVSLSDVQNPYGQLTVSFHNESRTTANLCEDSRVQQLYARYLQAANRCHANYLRLYLPNGSAMLQSPTFPLPDDYRGSALADPNAGEMLPLVDERDKELVGGIILTPPQATREGTFVYSLRPEAIFRWNSADEMAYNLTIAKQAGAAAFPVRVTIDLPQAHQLLTISPTPVSHSATTLIYETTLIDDLEISLTFVKDS